MILSPRRRGSLVVGLSILVFLLSIASLRKAGILTLETLAANKDASAAASSLISAAAIVSGALLTYFRFFRGRTLSVRAEVTLDVDHIQAPDGSSLHAITLHVRNMGTVSIWDPTPRIAIYTHGAEGYQSRGVIERWHDPLQVDDRRSRISVLDSAESATFFTHETYPSDVWAVTYIGAVACESGDVWKCAKTVVAAPTRKAVTRPD
jgi:hypothetical protein